MTIEESSSLLIWCGALHDIAEKSKEENTARQIKVIEEKIELLVIKTL